MDATPLKVLVREVLHRSPLRPYFFPKHAFNFSAAQLCFLCGRLEEVRDVPGSIAEIGCSTGASTVFLNNYLSAQGIDKPYVALDTFSGFTEADVAHEVGARGKRAAAFRGFQNNKKSWFEATMRSNGISRVEAIQADVTRYDLASLGPLAFVLLDVDLYRPIAHALPLLHAALAPGGVMVVDDCDARPNSFDGAAQAYLEFMEQRGEPAEVVHGKLGVIRRT